MLVAIRDDNKIKVPYSELPADPAKWLERHGDALYAFALLRVRDVSTAEDLVQDTLLAAISAREGFRGQSSERTWLTSILKHKVLDYYRSRNRERSSTKDTEYLDENTDFFNDKGFWRKAPGEWSAPDRALEQEQFWNSFSDCVDKLPEKLRLLYLLKEVDGIDTDEVIRTLNITSRSNLWTMLSRSRLQLRACLEKNWFGR